MLTLPESPVARFNVIVWCPTSSGTELTSWAQEFQSEVVGRLSVRSVPSTDRVRVRFLCWPSPATPLA